MIVLSKKSRDVHHSSQLFAVSRDLMVAGVYMRDRLGCCCIGTLARKEKKKANKTRNLVKITERASYYHCRCPWNKGVNKSVGVRVRVEVRACTRGSRRRSPSGMCRISRWTVSDCSRRRGRAAALAPVRGGSDPPCVGASVGPAAAATATAALASDNFGAPRPLMPVFGVLVCGVRVSRTPRQHAPAQSSTPPTTTTGGDDERAQTLRCWSMCSSAASPRLPFFTSFFWIALGGVIATRSSSSRGVNL